MVDPFSLMPVVSDSIKEVSLWDTNCQMRSLRFVASV